MKDRIIGGVIVIITVLIMLLPGGVVSASILGALSLIGVFEFYRVFQIERSIFAVISYLYTFFYYALLYLDKTSFIMPAVVGLLMLFLAIYVFAFPKYKDTDVFRAYIGFMYVAVLLSYVYRVRTLKQGLFLSFFILISSWGNDVFAYLVGSTIGKHKLSPKVSPKKSVEGFVGGIIGAAFVGAIYAFFMRNSIDISIVFCAMIAALGSIPSVIGDLAASAIKRNNEIKDYGKLIPGHGGILDRYDSVIFTAPIIYYLVLLFS
ncbi:MAG: phosphatidate cytidylyltransferase [Eubacteriales bacterium]|nr:phosphatidate cytidylyltransferase [Eubacteriales bacterium]